MTHRGRPYEKNILFVFCGGPVGLSSREREDERRYDAANLIGQMEVKCVPSKGVSGTVSYLTHDDSDTPLRGGGRAERGGGVFALLPDRNTCK